MTEYSKKPLVYVLPEYNPRSGSHFFYLYDFLSRAGSGLDIFVVVEKTVLQPKDIPFGCYVQKFSFPPLRFLELFFIMARERLRGRRYFYTHYSFFGAVASWLVVRLFGGSAFYWNCGMPWLYHRSFFREAAFRFALSGPVLVTGTAGIAAEYRRRYGLDPGRVRIMPNWIDVTRFQRRASKSYSKRKLNIDPGRLVVLFVHRLSRRKGSHLIPPVVLAVTKKIENVIFLVVGSGPEYENIKRQSKGSRLDGYIRLLGEVPNEKIQDYFAAADVFFMPSEEDGFPHVLLEAMAAGVPYVASDVGGVKEITPPALQNYIVKTGYTDGFASRIISLLSATEAEINRISEEETEWVRKYDTKAVLPEFLALFK